METVCRQVICFVVITAVTVRGGEAQAADAKAAEPSTKTKDTAALGDEISALNMVRVGLGGLYFNGTKLRGYGTRVPYHGVLGGIDLHVALAPVRSAPWFGYELSLRLYGQTTFQDAEPDLALSGALVVVPLHWKTTWEGSLVVGLGGGFGAVRPVWLPAKVHAYPHITTRLRLFPPGKINVHASWSFIPITTDMIGHLLVQIHSVEVVVGYQAFYGAARCYFDAVTGGDPERTYRGVGCGPVVGMGLY